MAYIQESSISSIPSRTSKPKQPSSLRNLVRNLERDIQAIRVKKNNHEQEHHQLVTSLKKQITTHKDRLLAKKKEEVLAKLEASMIAEQNESINQLLLDVNSRSSVAFDKKRQLEAGKLRLSSHIDSNHKELSRLSAIRYMVRQDYRQCQEREATVLSKLQLQKLKNDEKRERTDNLSQLYEDQRQSYNRMVDISRQRQQTLSEQEEQMVDAQRIIQQIDTIYNDNRKAVERYDILKERLSQKNSKTAKDIESIEQKCRIMQQETEELLNQQTRLKNILRQLQQGMQTLQQFSVQAANTCSIYKRSNQHVVQRMRSVASMEHQLSERVASMRGHRKQLAMKLEKILN